MQKITPFLWYDGQAEEAARLYTSVFSNARIVSTMGAPGQVMSVTIEIEGQQFHLFNGGPMFRFNESISLFVSAATQDEIDYLWNRLTADGGQESRCGWLKDRFGVSWQIVPPVLAELLQSKEPGRAQRAMQAMLGMNKLVIKELEEA